MKQHINLYINHEVIREVKRVETNISKLVENLLKIHLNFKKETIDIEDSMVNEELILAKEKVNELELKQQGIIDEKKRQLKEKEEKIKKGEYMEW